MRKRNFVNQKRSNEQRRVRYCFLRQIGFRWKTARILCTWEDENVICFIEQLNNLYFKGLFEDIGGIKL